MKRKKMSRPMKQRVERPLVGSSSQQAVRRREERMRSRRRVEVERVEAETTMRVEGREGGREESGVLGEGQRWRRKEDGGGTITVQKQRCEDKP